MGNVRLHNGKCYCVLGYILWSGSNRVFLNDSNKPFWIPFVQFRVVLVTLQDASFFLCGLEFLLCQIFYKTEMPLVDCSSTCEHKKQLRCVCKENMLMK